MAQDLLSTIRAEIAERMDGLRPLLAEQERLLVAAEALQVARAEEAQAGVATNGVKASRTRRPKRGKAALKAGEALGDDTFGPRVKDAAPKRAPRAATTRRASAKAKAKPARAARGAAREAILAALEHGSHTVGELSVVTAMTGPNVNGNLRRLAVEGVVVKTEREGKAAWALTESAEVI